MAFILQILFWNAFFSFNEEVWILIKISDKLISNKYAPQSPSNEIEEMLLKPRKFSHLPRTGFVKSLLIFHIVQGHLR